MCLRAVAQRPNICLPACDSRSFQLGCERTYVLVRMRTTHIDTHELAHLTGVNGELRTRVRAFACFSHHRARFEV